MDTKYCERCANNLNSDGSTCETTAANDKCAPNFYYKSSCIAVPPNMVSTGGSTTYDCVNSSYKYVDDTTGCTKCPDGYITDGTTKATTCDTCATGYFSGCQTATTALTCISYANSVWKAGTGNCATGSNNVKVVDYVCPANSHLNSAYTACICDAGYYYNSAGTTFISTVPSG